MMTRGILDPETYYYRRVYTDAVRAVDVAVEHPDLDADRIVVAGGSQGGGIAQAVAGLHPAVKTALVDVPFLSHFRRAVEITGANPYGEIVRYLASQRASADQVFTTLSYFDGVNFAARATATALYSVALMDDICPRRRCSPPTTTGRAPRTSRSGRGTTTRAATASSARSRSASSPSWAERDPGSGAAGRTGPRGRYALCSVTRKATPPWSSAPASRDLSSRTLAATGSR